jgi:hypothetical protein
MGLSDSFDHPELICVDPPWELDTQEWLVDLLADYIHDHRALDDTEVARRDVELVPVHGDWFHTNLLAAWINRYGQPEVGQFLQILPGASWFDDDEAMRSRRRLDRPMPKASP